MRWPKYAGPIPGVTGLLSPLRACLATSRLRRRSITNAGLFPADLDDVEVRLYPAAREAKREQ